MCRIYICLFLVAEHDRVVPPAMSRKLFDAANQPKELILLRGSGHNRVDANTVFQAVDRFLERNVQCP